jgi:hypothetical protein
MKMQPRLAIFILVLASSLQAAAAPLCSEVLTPSVATEGIIDVERTIEELARLKMTVDLEKASGASAHNSAKSIFKNVFKIKFAELVKRFAGSKTESEIKEQIQEKIRRLQENKGVEKTEEITVRKSQEETTVNSIYAKDFAYQERIDLKNGEMISNAAFEYVPSLDSLLLVVRKNQQNKTFLLSLKTKEFKPTFLGAKEAQSLHINASVNGHFFTNWTQMPTGENKVLIFDTVAAKESQLTIDPSVIALSAFEAPKIVTQQLSPSGNSLLLVVQQTLNDNRSHFAYLFDVATGKSQRLENLEKHSEFSYSYSFVNDHEVVFLSSKNTGREVLRHDLVTGQTDLIYKQTDRGGLQLAAARDGKSIVISAPLSTRTIVTVKLDGTPLAPESIVTSEINDTLHKVLPLPAAGLFVAQAQRTELMTTMEGKSLSTGGLIEPPAGNLTSHENMAATVDTTNEILFVAKNPKTRLGAGYIEIWRAKQ